MPDVGVDATIEKILKAVPASQETPLEEAPVEDMPVEGDKPQEELTAFEQELIEEFEPEDRKEFDNASESEKKRILGFTKKVYRKNAKQMTELGTLRKFAAALAENGITNEDLVGLVTTKRGGKQEARVETNGNLRGFKRWMDKATDPAERENLTEAEKVIKEMVEDLVSERLNSEVKPLRDRLAYQDREAIQERDQSLEADINNLEDEDGYPGSLIETYRDAMKAEGRRNPKLSAEDLLVRVAGMKVVKAAMLKKEVKENSKPKPATIVRKASAAPIEKRSDGRASVMKTLDAIFAKK